MILEQDHAAISWKLGFTFACMHLGAFLCQNMSSLCISNRKGGITWNILPMRISVVTYICCKTIIGVPLCANKFFMCPI